MNEKLKQRAEKNLEDINDAFTAAERDNCEIDYCFNIMEDSAKLIKELTEREAKLVVALRDIAGYNDIDDNSMMCDTHEECQNVADATLSELESK